MFANVVIGDEINRTSPKTQSALLEAMAEAQVTVDGVTRELESPFMIVATQNPIDMEGTYPLPEAQRDRFTARIAMGYPSLDAERQMLTNRGVRDPLSELRPIVDVTTLRGMIAAVRVVHVSPDVEAYIVAIVRATRHHPDLVLGASPRATLHLAQAARAHAALLGRPFVTPDDVAALAPIVLAHRLVPVARGRRLRGRHRARHRGADRLRHVRALHRLPRPVLMSSSAAPSSLARRAGAARSAIVRSTRRGLSFARRTPFPRPTVRGWTLLAVGIGLVGGGLVGSTSVAVSAGLLLLVLLVLGTVLAFVVAAPLRGSRTAARAVVQVGEVYRERVTLRGTGLRFGPRSTLLVREQLDDVFASVTDAETYATVGRGRRRPCSTSRRWRCTGPWPRRPGDDPRGGPLRPAACRPSGGPRGGGRGRARVGAARRPRHGCARRSGVGGRGPRRPGRFRGRQRTAPVPAGDPIRRVHWGQSARRGELHVRQTTQAQPPEAVIALDVRRESYQRLGATTSPSCPTWAATRRSSTPWSWPRASPGAGRTDLPRRPRQRRPDGITRHAGDAGD